MSDTTTMERAIQASGMLLAGMFVTMAMVGLVFGALGGPTVFGLVGVAVATATQFIGFLVVIWVVLRFSGVGARKGLALMPVDMKWMALAFVGGLTVSMGPTWGIQWLVALTGLDASSLDRVSSLISWPLNASNLPLILTVTLLGPVVEELLFRGVLWTMLEKWLSIHLVLLATTVLFALYHGDLVYALSVGFIGFFLGLLRMKSGSVIPGIAAHIINNVLAVVTLMAGMSPETSPYLALIGSSVAVMVIVICFKPIFRPRT